MLENLAAPQVLRERGWGDWFTCPGALSSGGFPSPVCEHNGAPRSCFLPVLGLCHLAPKDTIPCSVH